jgi:hypothetical protein
MIAPKYDLMELKMDLQVPIEHCEVFYIENDKLYDVKENYSCNGTQLTLYLERYKDYEIVINNHELISITAMSDDIIDEQDLNISFDGTYEFKKGVLVFTNSTAVWKQ